MKRTYFQLEDDLYFKERWYLNRLSDCSGIELDSREFQYGKSVDVGPPIRAKSWKEGTSVMAQIPLKVALDPKRKGVPLDFTFTNANLPVVAPKVVNILTSIASEDIQRIPVLVEAQNENYEIINIISLIDCIDIKQSEIQWYLEGNQIRPDKAGKPEMITKLVIDPMKVGQHHIFRLDGWEVAIIVSNVVRDAFKEANISGIKFRQV